MLRRHTKKSVRSKEKSFNSKDLTIYTNKKEPFTNDQKINRGTLGRGALVYIVVEAEELHLISCGFEPWH